ncbi:MAG: DNA repair protein RecO [Methylococcales bacterium]
MTENSVYLQPAFILQYRNYRETSLIIDVITRDFGRISLVAHGVRKAKSKTAGTLQPFIPLALSYTGKAELKTLCAVEIMAPTIRLPGLALYCGFYVNELISCFLHRDDPHPEVFDLYKQSLINLTDNSKIEATLRAFELNLMENVGYGLYWQHDEPVNLLEKYRFTIAEGLVPAQNGICSGKTLQAINLRDFSDPEV